MFSKIPVPRADWDKENMRYMMCFFPLIGVVIGVLLQGLGILWHLALLWRYYAGSFVCAAACSW